MHIKKIEISGFKSFVDRTVIHFDHDVVGIVGPNGCGKSNVVDAIRWCMGEQSAKHLRGRSMEDVIFNGSESRAAHGLAEVTLTFDNVDAEYSSSLPLEYRDYPEIAVARRLFRDGTSEYLINKTPVRLRDITELFLGTGVGTKAYSIVEQGRIGQIVSSRPEDRRLYIEEAAGITKYKQRRKQTERKIELTRQNLLRINDIVLEIERTSAVLKRQAAKAERFLLYRSELEDLSLHQAAHRLLELLVTERVALTAVEGTEAQRSQLHAEVDSQETVLEQARGEAQRIEQRADEASQRSFALDNQVAALQAEASRCHDRLAHLQDRERAAKREQEQLIQRGQELEHEELHLRARIADLSQDEVARDAHSQSEEAELKALREQANAAEAHSTELGDCWATASSEHSAQTARKTLLGERLEASRKACEACQGELTRSTEELQLRAEERVAVAQELEQSKTAQSALGLEVERQAAELEQLRAQERSERSRVQALQQQHAQLASRLQALQQLHACHEGVGAGARALLETGDALGIVADRVRVEPQYTRALGALLGDVLQAVVVRDPAQGLALLAPLTRNQTGRALIAVEHPAYVAGSARGPDDAACLGRVLDLLDYADEDHALFASLVGDAYLVQSADDVLRLSQAHPGSAFVSLEGTVVHPSGVLSGGAGNHAATLLVERQQEMLELQERVESVHQVLQAAVEREREQQARRSAVESELQGQREALHQQALLARGHEKDWARLGGEVNRLERRLAELGVEHDRVRERIHKDEQALAECEACLQALSEQLAELRTRREQAIEQAQVAKARADEKALAVTERKVRLAQLREQLEAARSSVERVVLGRDDVAERLDALAAELDESAVSSGEVAAQLSNAKLDQQVKHEHATRAHIELHEIRQLLEQIRAALGEREATLRELRSNLSTLEEELRTQQMSQQKLELERQHLLDGIREKFRGLDLGRVVGDYHRRQPPDAEHRRRIDELTKLLDRMGPVNLDAQREHEEAARRYQELSSQKTDIEQALSDLERAIRHMDRESRRRFRETFDAVNEIFRSTFRQMFQGGKAELVLTQPENLLETGVDIFAQPPGKKLGNIDLMSGGEKALTATALIFAMFRHRPSPFCVLDEVDAPLDEANVARYNEAVRSMTDRSQFILITHVKKTMASVDVLYGVTMGEPGVSRLVSVKVNEHARSRSERSQDSLAVPGETASQVA